MVMDFVWKSENVDTEYMIKTHLPLGPHVWVSESVQRWFR